MHKLFNAVAFSYMYTPQVNYLCHVCSCAVNLATVRKSLLNSFFSYLLVYLGNLAISLQDRQRLRSDITSERDIQANILNNNKASRFI